LSDSISPVEDKLVGSKIAEEYSNFSTIVSVDDSCSNVDPVLECESGTGGDSSVDSWW
jgi:hypothetical protein